MRSEAIEHHLRKALKVCGQKKKTQRGKHIYYHIYHIACIKLPQRTISWWIYKS